MQYICRSNVYQVSQKSAYQPTIAVPQVSFFLCSSAKNNYGLLVGELLLRIGGLFKSVSRWFTVNFISNRQNSELDIRMFCLQIGFSPWMNAWCHGRLGNKKKVRFFTISTTKLDSPPNAIFNRNQEGKQNIILMANFYAETQQVVWYPGIHVLNLKTAYNLSWTSVGMLPKYYL